MNLNQYRQFRNRNSPNRFHLIIVCSIVFFIQRIHTQPLFGILSGPGTVVSSVENDIRAIHQDSKGNHWFGSAKNGAYRFNGATLRRFTVSDGLVSDRIGGIQEDASGNLYFDTPSGVSVFNGKMFTTLVPVRSPANQWRLRSGDLWFKGAAGTNAVFRYDGTTLYRLEFSDILPGNYSSAHTVYCIYKDPRGNIWFGTESGGVFCFNGTALHRIIEEELGPLKDGRVPAIRSILEDADGYLWFSNVDFQYRITKNDKATLEYQKVQRVPASDRQQTTLPYYTSATTVNKELWMTAYNEGVWRFDGRKLTVQSITKNGRKIQPMSIYWDRSGVLWLGTDNDGVYVMKGKSFVKFYP